MYIIKQLLLCFFLIFSVVIYAQTAAELEVLLETAAVTNGQAARFVISSSPGDNSASTEISAFEQAVTNGWLKNVNPDDKITLGKLSFLIMKSFDMKGGLMYLIFPGPRYAYRSLVSKSIIQGASDPAMLVDGERFLLILGNVLNAEGEK